MAVKLLLYPVLCGCTVLFIRDKICEIHILWCYVYVAKLTLSKLFKAGAVIFTTHSADYHRRADRISDCHIHCNAQYWLPLKPQDLDCWYWHGQLHCHDLHPCSTHLCHPAQPACSSCSRRIRLHSVKQCHICIAVRFWIIIIKIPVWCVAGEQIVTFYFLFLLHLFWYGIER